MIDVACCQPRLRFVPSLPDQTSRKDTLLSKPVFSPPNVRVEVMVPYKTPIPVKVFAEPLKCKTARPVSLVNLARASAPCKHSIGARLADSRICLEDRLFDRQDIRALSNISSYSVKRRLLRYSSRSSPGGSATAPRLEHPQFPDQRLHPDAGACRGLRRLAKRLVPEHMFPAAGRLHVCSTH